MYNGIGKKCLLDIDYTKSCTYCGNTLRPALILCLGKEATSNCTASVSNLPRVGKSKILIFVKFNIFAKWHKARILEHVNGGIARRDSDSSLQMMVAQTYLYIKQQSLLMDSEA